VRRQATNASDPLVSICIPSFNYGRYLGDAITSALNQEYPNIEVVVCDNGSSDETFDVLASYRDDARVAIFMNSEPLSMVANHNAAIAKASGEYVVVLSADDVLLPSHVSALISRIKEPSDPVDIAFGQIAYCDTARRPIGTPFAYGILPVDYSGRDDFAVTLLVYSHSLPAKLIPKAIYERLGAFDESITRAFDVDLALRIELAELRVGVLNEVVAEIRIHPASASTSRTTDLLAYHFDKLAYLEKVLETQQPWRLEYIGRPVANMLENERTLIPPDALDPIALRRSESVALALRRVAGERHEWPSSRPSMTVVVHTQGLTKDLLATIEALHAQTCSSLEILVVQTKGVGVAYLLRSLGFAAKLRYAKAPHLQTPGGVLRLGIELSRARYVTYLEEGETVPADQYLSLLNGIESTGADFVYTGPNAIPSAEHRSAETEGHTPFMPVQRGEILPAPGSFSYAQLLIRRNLLIGVRLFDHIYEASAEAFLEALKFHFQYVFFDRASPTIEANQT
jgi:glycosyltransferase involved in cell wall biosynthesis